MKTAFHWAIGGSLVLFLLALCWHGSPRAAYAGDIPTPVPGLVKYCNSDADCQSLPGSKCYPVGATEGWYGTCQVVVPLR